ncbi:hypothetical protein CK203_082311 [Vitis vinifera]|uniref:DUF659 domain-containing protein n=1 Tax=Vitis vinifera TaxID=29760 RepID=A0A438ER08_VITVI|nr:hypothetical protein CK203_082311 [Vitis vinifera]
MNMGSEYVNEDLFGLEDEDIGEEINSRTNITNISSGGSNRGGSGGRTFSSKKPRQKGPMDHFFTPNAEMVVQNQRSGKMNQTTINDAYKKEARERACTLITRWMYEAAIPFNAVTYPSFQPMIEAIGQYGVGMKGPTFHEGTMFMQSIDASSMIKTGEKMFELLDKWVEQVGEENVIQVITDNHSSYVMAGLLNMMRRFTGQRELLRPAKTRFATAFITLSRLHEQKNNLRKMFTAQIGQIVSGPLVRVLRLVDGEKKAPMGYIYEAMNRAKDAIVRSFNGNEEKYKEIFNIIDKRLTRDPAKQEKVVAEVSLFTNAQGLFGNELAVRTRKTRAPVHQVVNGIGASLRIFIARGEIGRMEDEDSHGGAQDDFVFDDDNLTWGDVARAAGAEEARFDTRARARASSSIIPPTRGIASTDEEDGEGYKCGDGNDDDDDFVDLEEE